MMWQSRSDTSEKDPVDIRNLRVLLTLSVATSIDALITGISFGFIRMNIAEAVIIIAVITFIVSVIGAKAGSRNNLIPARHAEFAGGIVLIALGVKILAEHLAGNV
jgi:putative Mn2+ efflux pump MntP